MHVDYSTISVDSHITETPNCSELVLTLKVYTKREHVRRVDEIAHSTCDLKCRRARNRWRDICARLPTPFDYVAPLVFLVSDDSAMMTGTNLTVDGKHRGNVLAQIPARPDEGPALRSAGQPRLIRGDDVFRRISPVCFDPQIRAGELDVAGSVPMPSAYSDGVPGRWRHEPDSFDQPRPRK